MMKRREFIAGLGGTAAWPLAARAQQADLPVIGFLESGSPETLANSVTEFRKGLSESGYVERRNVVIEYRWANYQLNRLPELAADLVRRQVAVISATPTSAALAAKAATTAIPIVFYTGSDPVQIGLVASFNRPGGNLTGFYSINTNLVPKRLGLLHELLPDATRFGILVNPNVASFEPSIRDAQTAADNIGATLEVLFRRHQSRDRCGLRKPHRETDRGLGGYFRRFVPQPPSATRQSRCSSCGPRNLQQPRNCGSRRADELCHEPPG
jgi:putative ABC transport system substrate-binding protein